MPQMHEDVSRAAERRWGSDVGLSRLTSGVHQVRGADGSIRGYVKHWPDRKRVYLEELTAIDADVGMPNCEVLSTVPNGEADDTAECFQLMDPANGRTLSSYLCLRLLPGVWWRHSSRVTDRLREVGRVLGRLHSETRRAHPRSVDIADLHLDKYDAVARDGIVPSVTDLFDDRIVTTLDGQLAQLRGEVWPVSILHGDLMLFHVYTNPSNASLIDFDRARVGHPVEDCATFTCALDLLIRRLPYGRRSQYDELINEFELGYRDTGPADGFDADRLRVLHTVRLCSLLRYYRNRIDAESPIKLRILKRFDVPLLKRAIEDLARSVS